MSACDRMEEMIVIPKQGLPQDVEYYKGQLTGNALLEKAERLAAKKKRFLQDKILTDDQIVRKIKPLSRLPIGGRWGNSWIWRGAGGNSFGKVDEQNK